MEETKVRLAPSAESRPQDVPGFNRLHHVCLLWVDYLRAENEAEKQALLYEAASHLTLLHQLGDEGEEVFKQVWQAIRRREHGRVYIETDVGRNTAVAKDDGTYSTHQVLSDTRQPITEGIWRSTSGTRLEVYRVREYSGLLCVWGANLALASVAEAAMREAEQWQGHLPCDSDAIRSLGPWNYVGGC